MNRIDKTNSLFVYSQSIRSEFLRISQSPEEAQERTVGGYTNFLLLYTCRRVKYLYFMFQTLKINIALTTTLKDNIMMYIHAMYILQYIIQSMEKLKRLHLSLYIHVITQSISETNIIYYRGRENFRNHCWISHLTYA